MGAFETNDLFQFQNQNQDDGQKGKKRLIIIAIAACVVLIVVLACLIMIYRYIDSKTFKVYVNENFQKTSNDFMITDEEGNTYVKAKELAELIGWTYQNGEYGAFTEDTDAGYIRNGYEIASFKSGSTKLNKYIQVSNSVSDEDNEDDENEIKVNSQNGTMETMNMSIPAVVSDNQLYVPFEHINDICNCLGTYEDYRMNIYEQDYLFALAGQNAYNFGYDSVSGIYENIRALAYGMMIVSKDGNYGVVSLNSNEQILGLRYSDVIFNQNAKEFLVRVNGNTEEENTVGLISAQGKVIISPKAYDNLSVLSDELGLYLIEKNEKFGVLNRYGQVIVYDEFDSIGLNDELLDKFNYTTEDNKYLIYNEAIVTEKDGLYGLFDTDGNQLLDAKYEFGCDIVGGSSNNDSDDEEDSDDENKSSGSSLLKVELEVTDDDGDDMKLKGIVVYNESADGYGVYDLTTEKLIIPCSCDRIYSKRESGKVSYFVEFGGEDYPIEDIELDL